MWISLKMLTREVRQKIRSMFRIVKGFTFTHTKMVAAFDRTQPRHAGPRSEPAWFLLKFLVHDNILPLEQVSFTAQPVAKPMKAPGSLVCICH